jgi:hypothetical protein
MVKILELTNATQTIDRTGLSKGVYFVIIQNKQQIVATKKIILL